MVSQLSRNKAFEEFGDDWQVRDRPIGGISSAVASAFFQDRCHSGCLPGYRENSGGEACVEEMGDEKCEEVMVFF